MIKHYGKKGRKIWVEKGHMGFIADIFYMMT